MGHSGSAAYKPTQTTGSESIFTRLRRFLSSVNGAEGISDIEGKAATGSGERAGKRASFNGAEGISDIEGEAVTGSGQRAGKRASFNGAEGISDIEGEAATGSGQRAGKRASFKFAV